MYARVTQLEVDTVRVDMTEAVELFRNDILPDLRDRPGYRGVYVLATPAGQGVLVSLWDTEAQADASTDGGAYTETLERYMTLFKAPPGRGRYEVVVADVPARATGRTG